MRRPEAEQLLRLNRLAGNAAVVSLVVQRVRLSDGDKQRIKALDKKPAATAKKRIKAFSATEGELWNRLITFAVGSKVPGPEREGYLAELYRALGDGLPLDALTQLRTLLDRKYEVPARPDRPGKKELPPHFVPSGGVGFAPSLDEVKGTREKLVKHEEKKPPASWSAFPEGVRKQLTQMWDKWQRGETDAASFYDDFYKQSDAKRAMNVPSADQYVAALAAQDVLGSTSKKQATDSSSGYPIMLRNKGGLPQSRLYLNPHPRHVADVYRFVKDHVDPIPGVIWVKLADHARAMTVRDVIVIYLSAEHPGAERAVVDVLRNYQSSHGGHFLNEVPRLTRGLLPGVGVGDEPPNSGLVSMLNKQSEAMGHEERSRHDFDFGWFSFSTYRSTLVVRAIEDAGGIGGREDVFQSLVAEYFARGHRPHRPGPAGAARSERFPGTGHAPAAGPGRGCGREGKGTLLTVAITAFRNWTGPVNTRTSRLVTHRSPLSVVVLP
ncbi:T3SS effector HopA1 family protein [Amycolatopsis kentuckyensis]|uniref:T3SS effector HopA1 family protein n=1 Tax=Amycolatopsis kentuckyensis TaxID=218823 RepID=UPI00356A1212